MVVMGWAREGIHSTRETRFKIDRLIPGCRMSLQTRTAWACRQNSLSESKWVSAGERTFLTIGGRASLLVPTTTDGPPAKRPMEDPWSPLELGERGHNGEHGPGRIVAIALVPSVTLRKCSSRWWQPASRGRWPGSVWVSGLCSGDDRAPPGQVGLPATERRGITHRREKYDYVSFVI